MTHFKAFHLCTLPMLKLKKKKVLLKKSYDSQNVQNYLLHYLGLSTLFTDKSSQCVIYQASLQSTCH